jgi:hypothetical protein
VAATPIFTVATVSEMEFAMLSKAARSSLMTRPDYSIPGKGAIDGEPFGTATSAFLPLPAGAIDTTRADGTGRDCHGGPANRTSNGGTLQRFNHQIATL